MKKILFIGCGNMGGAILEGMLASNFFSKEDILILVPEVDRDIVQKRFAVDVVTEIPQICVEYIIFATKPQILDIILPDYKNYVEQCNKEKNAIIISIAAGKTVKYFQQYFLKNTILRTMPNLPATVHEGITGLFCPNKDIEKEFIEKIFLSIGDIVWVDKESDLDLITAMASSSPAYFCLLAEYIQQYGVANGLSTEISQKLATRALIGTGILCSEGKLELSQLRSMVTSEKGTTHAAIESFQKEDSLKSITYDAMNEAVKRAKELAE